MRQIKPRAAPQNQVVQPTERGDAFFMTRYRTIASLFAFAATAITLQTSPGLAFSSEAQQMCTGDAFRLCSSEIPSIPKVTACMISHRAQLSSGCRAVMDKELGKGKKVAANDE